MSLLSRFLGGDGKASARGLALIEEGRFSEAAEQLRLVALGSGGAPDDSLASYHFRHALLGEGRRLLRANEPARAVPWLAEAASLWPRYADLQFLHGAALFLSGGNGLEEALSAARRSLRLNPDYIEARLLEAEALARRERPRDAAASLNALVESGRRVAHWLVAELEAGAPYGPDTLPGDLADRLRRVVGGSSPKEEVAAAVALCRAGHWQDGLTRFEDLVRRHPRYPDYRTRQAAALFQLGRSEESLLAVEAALALNENYRLAQDLRGLVLADLLRVREARDHFRTVDKARAAEAPRHEAAALPAHEQLFGAYVRATVTLVGGDPAGALALLPTGPDLGREFARADLLRAAAEDLDGQSAACTRRLGRLAEQWPAESLYQYLLVCRLLSVGQEREAAQRLGHWPSSEKVDSRPLFLENLLRLEQGREAVAPTAASAAGPAVEPAVSARAWRYLEARAALRHGDPAAAWEVCRGLSDTGPATEPLVALQTTAALAMDGGPDADWEPPPVAPLAGLPSRVAWLHARGRGGDAEALATSIADLHPELAVGWWLSVRFWLAPIRAWVS